MKLLLFLLIFPAFGIAQSKQAMLDDELKKINQDNNGRKYKIDSITKTENKWIVYYKKDKPKRRHVKISLYIGPENKLAFSKTVPAK